MDAAIETARDFWGTPYYWPSETHRGPSPKQKWEQWLTEDHKLPTILLKMVEATVNVIAWMWPEKWHPQFVGGDDPVIGADCSGMVSECLRVTGDIGGYERLSSQQMLERFWDYVVVDGQPQRGDLLFYGDGSAMPGSSHPNVYHVALMETDYHMIEAGGGASGIDTIVEAAGNNSFVRRRPVEWRQGERVCLIRLWSEE